MTTFDQVHVGDRIELKYLPRLLIHDGWNGPLLLISSPTPCEMPGCDALVCEALASDGRWIPIHRRGWRPIDVIERAGLSVRGGDPIGAEAEELYRGEQDT